MPNTNTNVPDVRFAFDETVGGTDVARLDSMLGTGQFVISEDNVLVAALPDHIDRDTDFGTGKVGISANVLHFLSIKGMN